MTVAAYRAMNFWGSFYPHDQRFHDFYNVRWSTPPAATILQVARRNGKGEAFEVFFAYTDGWKIPRNDHQRIMFWKR